MRAANTIGIIFAVILTLTNPTYAHNEPVHRWMTDFAYSVLLAADDYESKKDAMSLSNECNSTDSCRRVALRQLATNNPAFETFYLDAQNAVKRLKKHYSNPHGCSAPPGEKPSPPSILASMDDPTGEALACWAALPDSDNDDWAVRSTAVDMAWTVLIDIAATQGMATASVMCAIFCALAPPTCALCPALTAGAGILVADSLANVDLTFKPDFLIGVGHFIDMKPTPSDQTFYDEKPAKLMERAGPTGSPDALEILMIAAADALGVHLDYDQSNAPKNYQITTSDFHPATTLRPPQDWENDSIGHLQFTPVDNLGKYGYDQAEPWKIGWTLHAIGDASVPMHVVGATGFGHRPYEEMAAKLYSDIVGSTTSSEESSLIPARALSTGVLEAVLQRAMQWRNMIQAWRGAHSTTEVPVRDLVTGVAAQAFNISAANPSVFKPLQSMEYLIDDTLAEAAYDNDSAILSTYRSLMVEGVAGEVALLMSLFEQ